jgi:hypothetical protein
MVSIFAQETDNVERIDEEEELVYLKRIAAADLNTVRERLNILVTESFTL